MTNNFARFCADHLPKRVVYFAAIRLGVYTTTGKYSSTVVPELSLMDAIKRWEERLEDKP